VSWSLQTLSVLRINALVLNVNVCVQCSVLNMPNVMLYLLLYSLHLICILLHQNGHLILAPKVKTELWKNGWICLWAWLKFPQAVECYFCCRWIIIRRGRIYCLTKPLKTMHKMYWKFSQNSCYQLLILFASVLVMWKLEGRNTSFMLIAVEVTSDWVFWHWGVNRDEVLFENRQECRKRRTIMWEAHMWGLM